MANHETAYPFTTVQRLVEAALERGFHEREAFLREACAGDAGLRRHVAKLLAEGGHLGSFDESEMLDESERSHEIVGRQIGPFRVLALVGAGAMGEVYRARDLRLGRDVAIKILAPDFIADPRRLARLKREARILASLSHPNVCAIHGYEIGPTAPPMPDGSHVHAIVLELIEGETLAERIRSAGALAPREAVAVAQQIAGAFEAVHQKGVIHRDLKPANVKVTPDGTVKVLDFGLAKVTMAEGRATGITATAGGAVCGTPAYMSPEQARGHGVDSRTDIWAFGCVLFEMLAGRLPFGGDTAAGVIARVLGAEPDWSALDADTPPELRAMLGRCLAKTPSERPADFTEIRRALSVGVVDLSGGSEPVGHEVASTPRRTHGHTVRRTRFATGITAAVVVSAIAAGGAYALWGPSMARGSAILTERDTIIVSEFTNRTGDLVFDGTLKLALTVALEQSPFLRVFPDARVREALPLMGRSAEERVTPVVAREIARREHLKALVAGSITSLGQNYVLTLEAINAETGDVVTREQSEVASKEHVLSGLESAARGLRLKLGESLPSIRRFDAPLPRATTSSIDALSAYALALEGGQEIPRRQAIPHLERAIELDPQFAMAHAFLSSVYANTGQPELAPKFSRRAFELRDRVSDRERFFISWRYYVDAEQAWDKALDLAQAWTTSYPREPAAFNSLGVALMRLGQFERAHQAFRTTIRLDPRMGLAYTNAAGSLLALNRPADALEALRQAADRQLEPIPLTRIRFLVALVQNDSETMARLLESSNGLSSTNGAFAWQAHASAFTGRVDVAHEQFHRGIERARLDGFGEVAGDLTIEDAEVHAVIGQCAQARLEVPSASALGGTGALARAGRVLAMCGSESDALKVMSELERRFPTATLTNRVGRPVIAALLALGRGQPQQAVTLLEPVRPFDYVPEAELWPAYLRGQAYLQSREPTAAAAEFSGVLEHRGVAPASVLYPLAYLGLGRAAALAGNGDEALRWYEGLFTLWSTADMRLAPLTVARADYRRLAAAMRSNPDGGTRIPARN